MHDARCGRRRHVIQSGKKSSLRLAPEPYVAGSPVHRKQKQQRGCTVSGFKSRYVKAPNPFKLLDKLQKNENRNTSLRNSREIQLPTVEIFDRKHIPNI